MRGGYTIVVPSCSFIEFLIILSKVALFWSISLHLNFSPYFAFWATIFFHIWRGGMPLIRFQCLNFSLLFVVWNNFFVALIWLLNSSLLVPCQFVVLRVHWGSINYQKRAIPANEQKRVRKTMKTNAGPAVRDEERPACAWWMSGHGKCEGKIPEGLVLEFERIKMYAINNMLKFIEVNLAWWRNKLRSFNAVW